MPKTLTDEELIEGLKRHGSVYRLAKAVGMTHSPLLERVKRKGLMHLQTTEKSNSTKWRLHEKDCIDIKMPEGVAVIASDFHVWPGLRTTAQRALLKLTKDLKPQLLIANGDVFDGATTSRFPSSEWNRLPTTQEELRGAKDFMADLAKAAGKAHRIWVMGNHDQRFVRNLVAQASAYEGVEGFDIRHHFPEWRMVYRATINPDTSGMTDVVHNWAGGVHAAYNNVLRSGVNYVTGHTHRLLSRHWIDRRGTRYGIETGTLMDLDGPQAYYTGGRPTDWCPGFVVLTYASSRLLHPEFVQVIDDGKVSFRGREWTV